MRFRLAFHFSMSFGWAPSQAHGPPKLHGPRGHCPPCPPSRWSCSRMPLGLPYVYSNNASSSLNLWIFQGSVALLKYEPTDQPFILLDLVVLLCILLASDEASLIPFPFLQTPLMCSVGRGNTFQKTLSPKKNLFLC